jgi:hypothetical protein
MINTDQAQALIADSARNLMRRHGSSVRSLTLLEFLVAAEDALRRAVTNNHTGVLGTTFREIYTREAAGLLLLAIESHGVEMYTTHALRRTLHPEQAPRRATLLEEQFLRAETRTLFNQAREAAEQGQPFPPETWEKLSGLLHRLGV